MQSIEQLWEQKLDIENSPAKQVKLKRCVSGINSIAWTLACTMLLATLAVVATVALSGSTMAGKLTSIALIQVYISLTIVARVAVGYYDYKMTRVLYNPKNCNIARSRDTITHYNTSRTRNYYDIFLGLRNSGIVAMIVAPISMVTAVFAVWSTDMTAAGFTGHILLNWCMGWIILGYAKECLIELYLDKTFLEVCNAPYAKF